MVAASVHRRKARCVLAQELLLAHLGLTGGGRHIHARGSLSWRVDSSAWRFGLRRASSPRPHNPCSPRACGVATLDFKTGAAESSTCSATRAGTTDHISIVMSLFFFFLSFLCH